MLLAGHLPRCSLPLFNAGGTHMSRHLAFAVLAIPLVARADEDGFVKLFTEDGVGTLVTRG